MNWLLDALIVVSSCGAIALLAQTGSARRWGFVVGLVGQPAWLYLATAHRTWGILAVAVWWTAWYCWGIVTHFGGTKR